MGWVHTRRWRGRVRPPDPPPHDIVITSFGDEWICRVCGFVIVRQERATRG